MKHLLALAAFCAAATLAPNIARAATYSVTFPPGFSLIANHLDNGGNTLDEVLPNVPVETTLQKWDCASQQFGTSAIFDGVMWLDSVTAEPSGLTLSPGEGALLGNFGPSVTLSFSGSPQIPVLPAALPCECGRTNLLSCQTNVIGTYENITGLAPSEGAQVTRLVAGTYVLHTFTAGNWTPAIPALNVGESALFLVPCLTNACLSVQCGSNLVVECGAEWDFTVPVVSNACCNGSAMFSVSSTFTNGLCPRTITRTWEVADDCGNRTTCSQMITLVDTTAPLLTCAGDKVVELGIRWNFDPPSALDSCCGSEVVIAVKNTVTNGVCPMVVTRTWRATDCCGNSSTCSQTVTVADTIAPVIVCSPVSSPNLVPNPGFEDPSSCPAGSGYIHLVAPWFQPTTQGTVDYFHACALPNIPAVYAGVPVNFMGHQAAHGGQGYAGAFSYGSNYREYMATPLTSPLVSGRTYEVSFYVSLSERMPRAIDNLGAHFSTGPVSNVFTSGPLLLPAQVQNPAGVFLSSTSGWMLVRGFYVAAGGEDHLTLGNFQNDQSTPVMPVNGFDSAYYYFDDVTVQEQFSPCPTNLIVSCDSGWEFAMPVALDLSNGTNVAISIVSTVTNGLCPRVVTRTWLAVDDCGNSSSFAQTITVVDTTPPIISCPTNIVRTSATNVTVCYNVTATDNCGGATVVCYPPLCSQFVPGTTTPVTCVATDACGNTNVCHFTVTVNRAKGDLFIEDTPVGYAGAPDQGDEPDADMIGQPMWMSRGIWVHQNCTQAAGNYLTHQNPLYGQQNCVLAEVRNRGNATITGAKVEFYYANASLGLSWPAQWTLIGTYSLPSMNAGDTHIAQASWYPPGTGHYCLIARIVSAIDPMTTPEGTDINANVRANNNLAWRNVNVTDCLHAPGDKVEVRVRNFEPAPKKLTLVFTADQDFLPDGGTAILSPGSSLFQRWVDAGSKGSNIEVINGNEIRFTDSPATFEDIPFGENEERVFNITLRADGPMPVPGTSHVYHAHLMQKIDGLTVGGVAYTIVTRCLDTDTDGDGIKDVDDPDDDNDGVPDGNDNNPVGELDCPPAALTINRNGHEVTITWNGLNYRLQTVRAFGDEWTDVPNASSPYVRTADGDHRFYRLICR